MITYIEIWRVAFDPNSQVIDSNIYLQLLCSNTGGSLDINVNFAAYRNIKINAKTAERLV